MSTYSDMTSYRFESYYRHEILNNCFMDLVNSLQKYLDNTSQEQLDKNWEKLKEWENVGPSVEEYINYLKENGFYLENNE